METKGMTVEELIAKANQLESDLNNEKALNEYRTKRIARLEEILNSIGIVYEAYQSDKIR